ncbi:NADPH-dependent oxidoreductase [Streptomyces sp. NPDC059695]|uniref:NADPH-dependent oxidoreductase n=1 Tax=Streptomyces sp. NPDC059695 TaxID=3346910 RepID=UPI003677DDDC
MDATTETTPLRAVTWSARRRRNSPAAQLLAEQTVAALTDHGVTGKVIRIADHDVPPGTKVDLGNGEAWPESRVTYGKAAAVCFVGNEDGANHVSAELFQGLNDVCFSLAANAVTHWVGEAMQGTDYQDLDKTPEKTAATTRIRREQSTHRELSQGHPLLAHF